MIWMSIAMQCQTNAKICQIQIGRQLFWISHEVEYDSKTCHDNHWFSFYFKTFQILNPFHSFKQKRRRHHPYKCNITKCNYEFYTSVSIIISLIFWPLDVRWEVILEKMECITRLTDSWVTFNAIKERAKLDKSVKRWDASDKIAIELERNPPISSAMKNTKHTDSNFQNT